MTRSEGEASRRSPSRWAGGRGPVATLPVVMGIVIAAIFVIAHFHRSAGAVLAVALGREPGFAPAEIGLVIGVMAFVSVVCQPFAGVVLDRYGALRTAAALAVLATLGQAVFAFSDSVAGLVAGRALIGIGFATAVSGVYVFLVGWVRPESFSTWAAVVLALGGTLGGFLASTPLAVALESVGRQPVFLAFAIATGLLAGAAYLLPRNEGAMAAGRTSEPVVETLRGLAAILTDSRFVRLSIFGIASYGPFMAVGGLWAGPYLRDAYGLEGAALGNALFAMVLAFNVGTLLYGPMDRLLDQRRMIILVGAAVQAALLLSLAVFSAAPLWLALGLLIAASAAAPTYVVMMGHGQALVAPRFAGRAITVMQIGLVGGTFALQYMTGLIVDWLAPPAGPIEPQAYRAVFAAVALVLVGCAIVYSGVEDARPSAGRPDGSSRT